MTDRSGKPDSQDLRQTVPISSNLWNGEDPVFPGIPALPPEMEGFELRYALGAGSVGTVYSAVQTKRYAVKVIPGIRNA